jgi:hypothetical protein
MGDHMPSKETTYAFCPKCKIFKDETSWKVYHKFCGDCGTELVHECPGCKGKIYAETRYCIACGHALIDA